MDTDMKVKVISRGDAHLMYNQAVHAVVTRIFVTMCNSDDVEGKGSTVDHSFHLTENDARMTAHRLGPMGASDGTVEPRLALMIQDQDTKEWQYYSLPQPIKIVEDPLVKANLRQSALGKLTDAEIRALLDQ